MCWDVQKLRRSLRRQLLRRRHLFERRPEVNSSSGRSRRRSGRGEKWRSEVGRAETRKHIPPIKEWRNENAWLFLSTANCAENTDKKYDVLPSLTLPFSFSIRVIRVIRG